MVEAVGEDRGWLAANNNGQVASECRFKRADNRLIKDLVFFFCKWLSRAELDGMEAGDEGRQ
jgi:hypothetical protein